MTDRITETVAVGAVMAEYTAATKARSPERLKKIFHENAVMTGYLGPDLLVGGPEPFYGALEANEVGDDYTSALLSVEVTGATATARVVESNLLGLSFVNDFHLIKTPEGWRIVSKLFHHDTPA